MSWSHPPSGTWGETETPQAHWNWDQYQRQETTLKHDSRTWSPSQTVQPKQLLEPGVASARSDEGDSGIEDDGIQTNSDATVRPVTLPEGWTVVLNSLRQVVYCHVKSGIACFQMPENPELLNGLRFEKGASSGSGDLSQKHRSDCKRKLSNRPESNKLKISRDSHPQRSSQYVENQVMVKSPSCWIDHFQTQFDNRRTTKLTRTAEPMLRDIIELKQAALWHGGNIRIDQASEAAAEDVVRQSKTHRISFRSEGTRALSGTHLEHTKSPQTSHSVSCVSSSSAGELPQMSCGSCREQSSTDASDSSMCGGATVRRDLKEPVAPVERSHEERVTFRWRRFLLLTHLVVTAFLQLCLMTQDEIRERKLREAKETRNRLRSANQEQQVAGRKERYRNQKPSPTVTPATIDQDLDPSKRPSTRGWTMRILDCLHPIELRAFRENAYLEWMTCLLCGARWSRKTGQDDIQ